MLRAGLRLVLRRSRAERMGDGISGSQQHQRNTRSLRSHAAAQAHTRSLGRAACKAAPAATGNLIGSDYKTPYAIHITGGVQHAFNEHWLVSADYTHEQGNHGYRAFPYTSGTNLFTPLISASDPDYAADQTNVVPNVNVFQSDNRSSYNALMLHLQGNMRRFSLVANYQLSKAQTWGCLLGELFDYVDGVCTAAERTQCRTAGCLRPRRLRSLRRRRSPSLRARRHGACSRRLRIERPSPSLRAPAPSPSPMPTTPARIWVNGGCIPASTNFAERLTSRRTCASPGPSRSASAGRSTRSPSSSTSSTATIPARITPSTSPSSRFPRRRCSRIKTASPTLAAFAPSPTAPKPHPSPA